MVAPSRLAIGCLLVAVVVFNPGGQPRLEAQETEEVPAVISTLVDLLPQDDGDPLVAAFTLAPSEAGSLADDPAGDVTTGLQVEPPVEGPDLVRFSWFTIPAQPLAEGFAALVASDPRPAGITLYGQESWIAPPPDATLVALVAEFDRPLTVTVEDACITQLSVRRPGPTTPEERLRAQDPDRDTNVSYQLAGWDTLPTYAVEADTSTPSFPTVVPDSSLFGVVRENQAALFIPKSQLDEVGAMRVSVRCTDSDPAAGTTDQSGLVPFDSDSLATAYLGPASTLPEPPTTTATTTTSGSAAAGEGDDSPDTADNESEETLEADLGLNEVDSSSPRDLLGPWAAIVGLAMTAAGGWILYHTPPWGRPDGSSAKAESE